MRVYALHGFLGKPSDWAGLFHLPLTAVDLFQDLDEMSLVQWGEAFHRKLFNLETAVQDCVSRFNAGYRILAGYSLGGRLALHALLHNPKAWDAALLISVHPGLRTPEERRQRLKMDEEWALRFENEPWESLMRGWNSRIVFGGDAHCFDRKEEDYSRKALAQALRQWSLGRQEDLLQSLSELDLPIFWIAGEQDQAYAEQAKQIQFKHAASQVWIAPGAGHRVPWRLREEFISHTTKFLNIWEDQA